MISNRLAPSKRSSQSWKPSIRSRNFHLGSSFRPTASFPQISIASKPFFLPKTFIPLSNFSTTFPRRASESGSGSDSSSSSVSVPSDGSTSSSSSIGEIKPKLSLTFTCTVQDCGKRSTHEFTKQAYTKGIVLVQCPGCKNRHLIADHLGWFTDSADEPRNIEQIVAAHGGRVRRGVALSDGEGGETLEIEGAEEISYETVEKKTRDDA